MFAKEQAHDWDVSGSSNAQEQAARVLNHLFETLQKSDSLAPIDKAMIVCQCHVHDGPWQNLLAHYSGALGDGVHAEDGGLGRVDDGRGQHAAVHAAIADGEGAARHVINADGAVPRLLAQYVDRALHAGKVQLVHVTQHWHYQALGCRHGNADIAVVTVDDVGAVDDSIHGGNGQQSLGAGLDEGTHEAQLHAMLLQKCVLVVSAQLHEAGHVHLVEGGQHGVGVLSALQPIRHPHPQSCHLHPPFWPLRTVCRAGRLLALRRGRGGSLGGRRRGHGCLLRRHLWICLLGRLLLWRGGSILLLGWGCLAGGAAFRPLVHYEHLLPH
mmetsp:Transcript_11615/g.34891  ORF Transcript_11615/g.34891 Transcript_11615/m.34891 type:complete len:327 (+) Transcript_11615:382-1362(+)